MTGQLQILACWVLATVLTTVTCKAEDLPTTVKRRSPTRISASITELEVQDRLSFSAEQRQKIAELVKERDANQAETHTQAKKESAATWRRRREITAEFEKKVRDELSPEQQTQWSRLKQLEFASFAGPAWRVLDNQMQEEITLTNTQAAAVDELQKEFCHEIERIMAATSEAERTTGTSQWKSAFMIKVREASAAFDARRDILLNKILTRRQYNRWIQIEWQRTAEQGGPAVLLEKSVIEYLTLSDAQQREIQTIADETKRQVEAERKERYFWEATKISAANLRKALTVLTLHQRRRWTNLLGQPYLGQFSRLGDTVPSLGHEEMPPALNEDAFRRSRRSSPAIE